MTAPCISTSDEDIVALNSIDCLPRGSREQIAVSGLSNPAAPSRSLSASSRTSAETRAKASATSECVSTRSASLPGVATTTCGLSCASLAACGLASSPPTTTQTCAGLGPDPKAAKDSPIWKASSLVGVSTSEWTP